MKTRNDKKTSFEEMILKDDEMIVIKGGNVSLSSGHNCNCDCTTTNGAGGGDNCNCNCNVKQQ